MSRQIIRRKSDKSNVGVIQEKYPTAIESPFEWEIENNVIPNNGGSIEDYETIDENAWFDALKETPEYKNIKIEEKLTSIRTQRDSLLDEVDIKYCNAEKWELFTDEQKTLWRAYKQQLRDLPETIDLDNPVFPTKPE